MSRAHIPNRHMQWLHHHCTVYDKWERLEAHEPRQQLEPQTAFPSILAVALTTTTIPLGPLRGNIITVITNIILNNTHPIIIPRRRPSLPEILIHKLIRPQHPSLKLPLHIRILPPALPPHPLIPPTPHRRMLPPHTAGARPVPPAARPREAPGPLLLAVLVGLVVDYQAAGVVEAGSRFVFVVAFVVIIIIGVRDEGGVALDADLG